MFESMLSTGMFVGLLALCVGLFAAVFRQAGYTGWWGLVMVVPLVNVIAFVVLALREWPVTR